MQLHQAAAVNQLAVTVAVTVAEQHQAAVANRLAVTATVAATVAAQLQAVVAKPLAEMVAMQVLAESPRCIIAC